MPNILTRIRQNHALEHATLHLLARRYPIARLMGRSSATGFMIVGDVTTEVVADAAAEAIARLQQGEAHLAVHPRCGTNLVVTGTLVGAAGFVAAQGRARSRLDRLPLALLAATVAAMAAQPLAYLVQERLTTTPDVGDAIIEGVTRMVQGRIIVHKVRVGHR